jgi:hypothetical protein
MGGAGDDVLDDAQGGGTRFFDHEGRNQVAGSRGTRSDDRPYEHPLDTRGYRQLDWGGLMLVTPGIRFGGDVGLVTGARVEITRYGFRQHPWASRHAISAAYAFGRRGGKLEYDGRFRHSNSSGQYGLFARVSDIETVRFHGFGNDTAAPGDGAFYRSTQREFLFQPSLRIGLTGVDVRIGPRLKYQETALDEPSLLAQLRPYGVGEFGQVGANASIALDTRARPDGLGRGLRVAAEANVTRRPGASTAPSARSTARWPPTPASWRCAPAPRRSGGTTRSTRPRSWAGPDTVRGIARQRYAGDAALYGNAELRLPLVRFKLLMPVRAGVFGWQTSAASTPTAPAAGAGTRASAAAPGSRS